MAPWGPRLTVGNREDNIWSSRGGGLGRSATSDALFTHARDRCGEGRCRRRARAARFAARISLVLTRTDELSLVSMERLVFMTAIIAAAAAANTRHPTCMAQLTCICTQIATRPATTASEPWSKRLHSHADSSLSGTCDPPAAPVGCFEDASTRARRSLAPELSPLLTKSSVIRTRGVHPGTPMCLRSTYSAIGSAAKSSRATDGPRHPFVAKGIVRSVRRLTTGSVADQASVRQYGCDGSAG